jgi:hypothetical protein
VSVLNTAHERRNANETANAKDGCNQWHQYCGMPSGQAR